ncbi:MAG: hypothetical protein AABX25_04140, partial [Nanoarchaeota archaeon]
MSRIYFLRFFIQKNPPISPIASKTIPIQLSELLLKLPIVLPVTFELRKNKLPKNPMTAVVAEKNCSKVEGFFTNLILAS